MKIAFVLFPNLTQLDFTGPLQFLARTPGAETQLLARSMEPIPSDCGLSLMPTGTFAKADDEIDLLCIPGGFGVSQAIEDSELMDFVRRAGAKASWHTSVCTGAFVLGAAGLLQGKRATTHWAYHELLSKVGAIPTAGRVVRDGQVITGGGVTAGIDFALQLVAELHGPKLAQSLTLGMEYDPQPPFAVGHPDRAPAPLTDKLRGVYAKRRDEFAAQLDRLS